MNISLNIYKQLTVFQSWYAATNRSYSPFDSNFIQVFINHFPQIGSDFRFGKRNLAKRLFHLVGVKNVSAVRSVMGINKLNVGERSYQLDQNA